MESKETNQLIKQLKTKASLRGQAVMQLQAEMEEGQNRLAKCLGINIDTDPWELASEYSRFAQLEDRITQLTQQDIMKSWQDDDNSETKAANDEQNNQSQSLSLAGRGNS